MTSQFSFEVKSGDAKTVSINKHIVQGISSTSGSRLLVGCAGKGACNGKTVSIEVSNKPVSVNGMDAWVLNGLKVSSDHNGGAAFDNLDTFKTTITATQKLTAEGHTARVFSQLRFSDSEFAPVTSGMVVKSLVKSVLGVSDEKTGTVKVQVGAAGSVGKLLGATWMACGKAVASANPYVIVDMPAVTWIKLTVNKGVIHSKSDPLAKAPVNRPTEAKMSTTVYFEDKSKRDFSADNRVTYTIADTSGVKLVGTRWLQASGSKTGTVVVKASLPKYAPKVAAGSVSIAVDAAKTLTLYSEAFPACV
jgi:hypothetical protein